MYHKDTEVWKKSIELVKQIYSITKTYPKEELFSLTNQMRRAAVSIPSNIAEGCARATDKEAIRFLDIAIGSLAELDTQLVISQELGLINDNPCEDNINKISALIIGLKKYLLNKYLSINSCIPADAPC